MGEELGVEREGQGEGEGEVRGSAIEDSKRAVFSTGQLKKSKKDLEREAKAEKDRVEMADRQAA